MEVNPDVLNSWKEVAVYLGRGVRTVQRWERDLNMPVRRPRGTVRSAVIAFKQELDGWLLQTPIETREKKETFTLTGEHLSHKTIALMTRNRELVQQSNSLCRRSSELCVRMSNAINTSMRLVAKKKPETDIWL